MITFIPLLHLHFIILFYFYDKCIKDAGKTVPINGKIKRGNAVTATVTGKLAEIADENFVVS
jgi:hypothetical protein